MHAYLRGTDSSIYFFCIVGFPSAVISIIQATPGLPAGTVKLEMKTEEAIDVCVIGENRITSHMDGKYFFNERGTFWITIILKYGSTTCEPFRIDKRYISFLTLHFILLPSSCL